MDYTSFQSTAPVVMASPSQAEWAKQIILYIDYFINSDPCTETAFFWCCSIRMCFRFYSTILWLHFKLPDEIHSKII